MTTAESEQMAQIPSIELSYPINVIYCGECSMPIEYCEYSQNVEKCQAWLERNLPELVEKQARIGGGEDGGLAKGEGAEEPKKHQKRGGKGAQKTGGGPKGVKGKAPHVTLKTEVRSKNKAVTIVRGLGTCGIDLKAASKFFSNRFACGCSVVGGANGDELVIQGDFKDELFDVIPEKWPSVDEDLIEDLSGDQRK